MTIVFDPKLQRSTHIESGLAVQWVRDEPPMERCTHFKLIIGDVEVPFQGYHDSGDRRILEEFPNISALELSKKMKKALERNYYATNINFDFDKNIFVSTWKNLVSQRIDMYKVSTIYIEYTDYNPETKREWSCEG